MDKQDAEALYPQSRLWFNDNMAEEPFYARERGIYTAKGRGTSLDEREEIVKFCLEHGKNYVLTIKTFKISYQQIYSWVRKYEKKGVDGLTDRRGRSKSEEELTEEDRLRRENKALYDRIKEQEVQIALLKRVLSASFGTVAVPALPRAFASDIPSRVASCAAPDFALSSHAPVSDVTPLQPLLLAEDL